ncbi:hypothetical protein FB451DRAFT_1138083 [Mycena latifolia]|nr:hypothetical protein FB451DRAFT_1138083 [Mycena latifolia]
MDSAPKFPRELEREIFEMAALMHPGQIPTLLRVASRVLLWTEPVLYRVVRVDKYVPYSRGLLNAIKSKPPSFLQGAVRHLLLRHTPFWTADEGTVVLKMCTGVVNLAIFGRLSNPSILPILANMRVQRLCVSLIDLFGENMVVDLTHPLFEFITHLDVLDVADDDDVILMCSRIPVLPALTHLCLNGQVLWHAVDALLAECPRLGLLANFWHRDLALFAYQYAQDTPVHDPRFVVGLYEDYNSDWEAGAKGLPDFWSRADDFVARKRNGAIEAGCYWLENGGLAETGASSPG